MAWQEPSEARAYCTGLAAASAPPSAGGSATLNVCAPVGDADQRPQRGELNLSVGRVIGDGLAGVIDQRNKRHGSSQSRQSGHSHSRGHSPFTTISTDIVKICGESIYPAQRV